MRRQPITFVGPVQAEPTSPTGKPHSFLLLQPNSDPLKLTYSSRTEALRERFKLLGQPGFHSVKTLMLFKAIMDAMSAVKAQPVDNDAP